MYHFRYYALGHSYLLHGPFQGWQTEGIWGMAASEPGRDYFHLLQDRLRQTFDCTLDAVAENHADYERRCVVGATRESYEASPEYAHIREVLSTFKPNLISLFLGDGNTVAKDEASAALFFDVLYDLIAKEKREDAVVVCVCFRKAILETMRACAEAHGFLAVDATFLHENKGADNPYYAFRQYPEYDSDRARGAVEFRTHPGDEGHDAIANAMLRVLRDAIPSRMEEGALTEPYEYEKYRHSEQLPQTKIAAVPDTYVAFHGFNARQVGECVTFGSAPNTGAAVEMACIHIFPDATRFYIEMAVEGILPDAKLIATFSAKSQVLERALPLTDEAMRRYEFDLSDVQEPIFGVRVAPSMKDCVLTVKAIGFQ